MAVRALDFRPIRHILFHDSDTDEGDAEAAVVVVGHHGEVNKRVRKKKWEQLMR